MTTYQKTVCAIIGGAVLLLLLLSTWIPWPALIVILIVGAIAFTPIVGQIFQIVKARTTPIPVYIPKVEVQGPAAPPAEQPRAEAEAASYTQGYQAQTKHASTWSPFLAQPTSAEPQPHADRPGEVYEEALVQYPSQVLPPQS